jgi:hypothetical protein
VSDKINYQFALRRWGAKHVKKRNKKVAETKKPLMTGGQNINVGFSHAGVTLTSHFEISLPLYARSKLNAFVARRKGMMRF